MIGQVFTWFFSIFFIGLIFVPVSRKIFSFLPDKGYSFSKIIGLFLWGYFYWLFATFHLIQNNLFGAWLVLILLILFSFVLQITRGFQELFDFFKANKRAIITTEIVFLISFIFMAIMRGAIPEIAGTEKPMELAFINSILQSPQFPPHDPWLSGYSISYYYFGYILIALLTQISGVSSGVAFNLSAAMWFGLTAIAAYGLLYNLLKIYQRRTNNPLKAHLSALLAPIFVLLVSNIEGFLEILHARGLFWTKLTDGSWFSSFWGWLGILELNQPPVEPLRWLPNRPGGIVWWRASRVISDYNLSGDRFEVIDEFPFFSYLLSDLHPHVLSMPIVILAMAIALNFLVQLLDSNEIFITRWLRKPEFWWGALVFGGLSFLNTWDFPIYVGLTSAVFAFALYLRIGWHNRVILQFLLTGLSFGLIGGILYLPFYLGFSSQAGGFLPSLSFFTRGVIFWVMFVPLILPIIIWMFFRAKGTSRQTWLNGIRFSGLIVFGLWLLSYLLGLVMLTAPNLISSGGMPSEPGGLMERLVNASGQLAGLHGRSMVSEILGESLVQRLTTPGTWITLFLMLLFVWVILGKIRLEHCKAQTTEILSRRFLSEEGFVVLMVFVGIGLTLFPEFIYLRDQFATRMNTIFKFYFQAWILWGIAAAYAVVMLFQQKNKLLVFVRSIVILVIAMGLVYPATMTWIRTNGFQPAEYTLNGNQFRERYETAEFEAAEWLSEAPHGTIAEAVGGSYSGYARMATLTGLPNVLGWVGHELQWRGGVAEMGSRESDIRLLYETFQWEEALQLIKQYDIRYIVVGNYERNSYNIRVEKFMDHLPVAFQNQEVLIFDAFLYIE